MRSMSNQFYRYVTKLVLDYFINSSINAGDRFYLQLDKINEVESLIHTLKEQEHIKEFVYQHELGEPYTTFSIDVNKTKVVIAYTSGEVNPDFLVTLRNQVGEQKGVWEGTVLLSIVTEQLDSIQGGSSDLQKDGMPLHPNYLYKKLKTEIENSKLSKIDQIILLDNMKRLIQEQPYQQITFFDFEEMCTTLFKGFIEDKDYINFGLFRDEDLDTYTGNKLKDRLEVNRELFDYVRKVHDFGSPEEELEKKFSSQGVNKLKTEEWNEQSFSDVNRFHEEYKTMNKNTTIDLRGISVKNGLKYWDRAQKETTAAGKRKRHIVIFNPEQNDLVDFQASFTVSGGNVKSLSEEFLTLPAKCKEHVEVKVGITNINVSIQVQQDRATFAKITYKHDKKASLGIELFVVVIPVEQVIIDQYRTCYLVDPIKEVIELQYEGNELVIGQGYNIVEIEVHEYVSVVNYDIDDQLIIRPQAEAFNDDEELQINISLINSGSILPLLLKNEIPETTPITGFRIWKLKREHLQDFEWKNNRLIFGNREYYTHAEYKQYFEWERTWLDRGLKCAVLSSEELIAQDLDLGDDLREAYSRYLNLFSTDGKIPSLRHYNSELTQRAKEYVKAYVEEIKSFKEVNEAGKRGRDLFKLGTIQSNNRIYFTPFHPMVIAYQLKIYQLLSNEEVENSILSRLNPNGLIPYIYYEHDQLYKPDSQQSVLEWMIFKPVNQVSVTDANQYLAKVIEDKIFQFEEHFEYLFIDYSKAPLLINIINISNDQEVIKGLIKWMLKRIELKGPESLKPIEVTIYKDDHSESSFNIFSRTDSVEQFEEIFNIKLKSSEYEAEDLIRFIRDKLQYFKREINGDYKYSHISFYKMQAQEKYALQSMEDMVSGITLDGLYTSVPSMKSEENYRSGFGTKSYTISDSNLLAQTAYYINELGANLRNGGNDTYRKGEAIFSRTTNADEKTLEKIFKSSYWVTFVDPNVDLEFFNDYQKNLVVIHYSDQYSSSSRYDAITVTDKSQQYHAVIKEFLKRKDVDGTEENVKNTIQAFNTFNGEWLLRIIGGKGHFSREKLSIISAIKFSLSYFDHREIVWVPISLEEILRVAGAVSLNKADGVFTAKNLGVKGSHSDDLLLIGLENNNDQLKMHFYPIEVKIGANKNDVLEKAKKQIRHTKSLIKNALTNDAEKNFTSKFYCNFFTQLYISNAKKLLQSSFWDDKNYQLSDKVIEKLLKDQYTISNQLEPIIGEGAILSFQREAYYRSSSLEDGITLLNLTENDGYVGLVRPIKEMHNWIQKKENDFVKENLVSYQYRSGVEEYEIKTVEEKVPSNTGEDKLNYTTGAKSTTEGHQSSSTGGNGKIKIDELEDSTEKGNEEVTENKGTIKEEPKLYNISEGENITHEGNQHSKPDERSFRVTSRILIGKAENSNREIYWEYGNKDLANRHLLISGKSGQGKTYFMQCLLLEKSKQGIPSIVVDYTEGFLPNQLEPEFVEFMGDKLKQKVVYSEQLPINPFKKNVRDIGGITIPESDTDIAERIKSVFSAVYKSLGIQQQNAIYEAVLRGLEKHNDNMSLVNLKQSLEEDNSSYAKTALSQIRPLIDRNPFSHENTIDWNKVVDSNGEVFIIQLTGYPRDVQLMITEFILWDLWNYSVKFGNKDKPMPVIMDEAQNLDHTEKSPSARILTEGRKFGWSAWYATQFLKSQLDADELARLQNATLKVYFSPPEQEVSSVATSLSSDQSEKKKWESRLASLRKGQCVVHGPILKGDGELSKPTVTIVDIAPLSERK